jgi:hypothetical protein
MNKARIEHAEQQERSKKGKGKAKETQFDMSSVIVPPPSLLAHSVSSMYHDQARIHLRYALHSSI